MTAPNENPVRFADGINVCRVCEVEPCVGDVCTDCADCVEEWDALDCDPRACRCEPEQAEDWA